MNSCDSIIPLYFWKAIQNLGPLNEKEIQKKGGYMYIYVCVCVCVYIWFTLLYIRN